MNWRLLFVLPDSNLELIKSKHAQRTCPHSTLTIGSFSSLSYTISYGQENVSSFSYSFLHLRLTLISEKKVNLDIKDIFANRQKKMRVVCFKAMAPQTSRTPTTPHFPIENTIMIYYWHTYERKQFWYNSTPAVSCQSIKKLHQ